MTLSERFDAGFVQQVMNNDTCGECGISYKETLELFRTEILRHCREVVPEEKDIKAHQFADDDAAMDYGNLRDTIDYFKDLSHNACRTEMLDNIDKL